MANLIQKRNVLLYGRRGFNPRDIPGIRLWLSADAGVTLVGGAVDAWADLSGNGQNVTAPSSTDRPSYSSTLNGRNVLTFNGSNSCLVGSLNNNLSLGQPVSIFAAWRKNSTAYKLYETLISAGTTGSGLTNASRTLALCTAADFTNMNPTPTFNTDIWQPSGIQITNSVNTNTGYQGNFRTTNWQFHRTLANSAMRLGRVARSIAVYSKANPISLNNNPYQVGVYDRLALPTSFFGGDIAEIIVYQSFVSDAATIAIENYLNQRWGV